MLLVLSLAGTVALALVDHAIFMRLAASDREDDAISLALIALVAIGDGVRPGLRGGRAVHPVTVDIAITATIGPDREGERQMLLQILIICLENFLRDRHRGLIGGGRVRRRRTTAGTASREDRQ